MVTKIRMSRVMRAAESGASPYWFTPKTLSFFGSQFGGWAYAKSPKSRKAFFITSEKQPSFRGHSFSRKYSVRSINLKSGSIDTVGEFQKFADMKSAKRALDKLVK